MKKSREIVDLTPRSLIAGVAQKRRRLRLCMQNELKVSEDSGSSSISIKSSSLLCLS